MRCYRASDRRKQLGIKEEITLYTLPNSGPLGSRLPAWGLVKRSLISRARYRYWMGVPEVAGCLRAGFGVFIIIRSVFGSSLSRARFGSASFLI